MQGVKRCGKGARKQAGRCARQAGPYRRTASKRIKRGGERSERQQRDAYNARHGISADGALKPSTSGITQSS